MLAIFYVLTRKLLFLHHRYLVATVLVIMGHHFPDVGSDTSKFSEEGSDSIIQINVMTTDTRIHSFTVNRNVSKALVVNASCFWCYFDLQ